MKGARGLLISIAGGKDLTLFEVDEAATRIREEADLDANIIVGAAFDDSLDGVIRVSVVATGVDQNGAMMRPEPRLPTETRDPTAESHSAAAHETRIAELAPQLHAENKRIAERLERIDHSIQTEQFAAAAPETEQEDFQANIDAVATAAVAEALFEREIDDVSHRRRLQQRRRGSKRGNGGA
jgi:cell division protein FtsZ